MMIYLFSCIKMIKKNIWKILIVVVILIGLALAACLIYKHKAEEQARAQREAMTSGIINMIDQGKEAMIQRFQQALSGVKAKNIKK